MKTPAALIRMSGIALAFALAAAVLAGQGTIQPSRVQKDVKGVKIDTRSFNPQIDRRLSSRPYRPENPIPPIQPGPTEGNTIPLGQAVTPFRHSVSPRLPGIEFTGWTPPDPNLAIGPQHLVQVVNSSVAFINRATGQITFQQTFNTFFSRVGAGSFCFDPKAAYDPIARRFYVLALDVNFSAQTSHVLLGVSQTSNPNGGWNLYKIDNEITDGSNSFWLDYPTLGFNKDAIVYCGNMFGFANGWAGVQILVIRKAEVLDGRPATQTSLRDPSLGSAQFSRTTDATSGVIYGIAGRSTTQMRLYAIVNGSATPSMQFVDVAVPEWRGPQRPATSAGGRRLDSLDGRIYNITHRGQRLVAAHPIATPGSDTVSSRWYEFSLNGWPTTGTPATRQSGNITDSNGNDLHMPAIGINRFGDITTIFTRSGPDIAADVMISSRRANDPLGRMSVPQRIDSTPAPYGGAGGTNRWGDYFDVGVDPNDDATFYGTAMVGTSNGQWLATFYRWQVTPPSSAALKVAPRSIRVLQGTDPVGTVGDVAAVDIRQYTLRSILTQTVGQSAGVEMSYLSPVAASQVNSLTFNVRARAVAGATLTVWARNWRTGQTVALRSFPLTTAFQSFAIELPTHADYINSRSREMVLTVRANVPFRQGRPNPSFQLGLDLAQAAVLPASR